MQLFIFSCYVFALYRQIDYISKMSKECLSCKDKLIREEKFFDLSHSYLKPVSITSSTTVFHDTRRNYVIKRVTIDEESTSDEIKHSRLLSHPNMVETLNIISTYNIKKDASTHYIISEYLDVELQPFRGLVDENVIKKVCKDILSAIKYLHDNDIAHLDIKYNNIMGKMGVDGNITYKLIDFGFSKVIKGNDLLDRNRMYYGTFPFAPPEVYADHLYAKSSDIWSFGATIYMLVSDPKIFFKEGEKNYEVYREFLYGNLPLGIDYVSDELKNFILKCLVYNYADRPSAQELLDDEYLRTDN